MVQRKKQPFFFNPAPLEASFDKTNSVFFSNILQVVFLPSKECNGVLKWQFEILKRKSEQFEVLGNETKIEAQGDFLIGRKLLFIDQDDSLTSDQDLLDENTAEPFLENNAYIDLSLIVKVIEQIKPLDLSENKSEDRQARYIIGVIPDEFLTRVINSAYQYQLTNKHLFEERYKEFNRNDPYFDLNQINIFVRMDYISDSIKFNQFLSAKNYMINIKENAQDFNLSVDARINLQKATVIRMLKYWKDIFMETCKMVISNNNIASINNIKIQQKLRNYFKIINDWKIASPNVFEYPITKERIVDRMGTDYSIASKIIFVLDYISASGNTDIEDEDIIAALIREVAGFSLSEMFIKEQVSYFKDLQGFGNLVAPIITYFMEFEDPSITGFKSFFLKFPDVLTWETLFGWRYYSDFKEIIPKKEVKYHNKLIEKFCNQTNLSCIISGSSRRSLAEGVDTIKVLLYMSDVNDINVLILKRDKLIQLLIEVGYIDCILSGLNQTLVQSMITYRNYLLNCVKRNFTADVSKFTKLENFNAIENSSKTIRAGASVNADWFKKSSDLFKNEVPNGVFVGENSKLKRQDEIFTLEESAKNTICRILSFEVAPYSEVCFKLLITTGSYHFIKSVQQYCRKNSYRISERSLIDLTDNSCINFQSQNDSIVLEYLGLFDYIPLKKRDLSSVLDLTKDHEVPARAIEQVLG